MGRLRSRNVLSTSIAAALLAGCAGSVSPIGTPHAVRRNRAMAMHAAKYYLYAIAPKNSEVHVYPLAGKHQKEIGHIDHLPAAHGIATDRAGNLFVAVSARAEVRVYAPMTKKPFRSEERRVGKEC